MMQSITHQKPQCTALKAKWLQRVCSIGFVFFLVKGLAWIVAAVWFIR